MGGGGAFGSAAWGTQDAWALTAFPAPQDEDTPLHLALEGGHAEVAKVLREAGAVEERIDTVSVIATRPLQSGPQQSHSFETYWI